MPNKFFWTTKFIITTSHLETYKVSSIDEIFSMHELQKINESRTILNFPL